MAQHSIRSTSSRLKLFIQLDAATSLLGAFLFLGVGISPLASILGFTDPIFPIIVGIGLFFYVAWLLFISRGPEVHPRNGLITVCINDAWVLASIILLLVQLPPLTLWGKSFVILIALIVEAFGLLQFSALLQQRREVARYKQAH
uniref:Uncharacterized protein n=1 Tax=Thermosporothrix sp. COM3 TaxID=2490863 RepID=A0A455SGJ4_9CHLR|nr:hypothetical protein KTC_14010 [Thermosporothrix sp. COM3]